MGDGWAVARLAASEGERPFAAVCGAERNRPAVPPARNGDGLPGQRANGKVMGVQRMQSFGAGCGPA